MTNFKEGGPFCPTPPPIFPKIPLLIVYNAIHKFKFFVFVSKAYLDADITSNDENLSIPGYIFTRLDHPDDV